MHGKEGLWGSRWRARLESWQLLLKQTPGLQLSGVAAPRQARPGDVWLEGGCEFLAVVFGRNEGKESCTLRNPVLPPEQVLRRPTTGRQNPRSYFSPRPTLALTP